MMYYTSITAIYVTMQKDSYQNKLRKARQKCNLTIYSDGTCKFFAKKSEARLSGKCLKTCTALIRKGISHKYSLKITFSGS